MRPPSLGPNTTRICFPCASRIALKKKKSPALCTKAEDRTWGQWETLPFSPSIPDLPEARDFRMRCSAKPVPLGALGTGEWKTRSTEAVQRHRQDRAWPPTRSTQLRASSGGRGLRKGLPGCPGLDWVVWKGGLFFWRRQERREEKSLLPALALLLYIVDFILPNGGCLWDHRAVSLAYLFLREGQGMGEGFQGGSVITDLPANAEDAGSIPRSGRAGQGNDNPLQYSCLGNPTDRGAWRATDHQVANSRTWLSNRRKRLMRNREKHKGAIQSSGLLLPKSSPLWHTCFLSFFPSSFLYNISSISEYTFLHILVLKLQSDIYTSKAFFGFNLSSLLSPSPAQRAIPAVILICVPSVFIFCFWVFYSVYFYIFLKTFY